MVDEYSRETIRMFTEMKQWVNQCSAKAVVWADLSQSFFDSMKRIRGAEVPELNAILDALTLGKIGACDYPMPRSSYGASQGHSGALSASRVNSMRIDLPVIKEEYDRRLGWHSQGPI